jgi:hypothetical protein
MSMKNSSDTIGNRTRDVPVCRAVPQPTAPPRAPDIQWNSNISESDNPALLILWHKNWEVLASELWREMGDHSRISRTKRCQTEHVGPSPSHAISVYHFPFLSWQELIHDKNLICMAFISGENYIIHAMWKLYTLLSLDSKYQEDKLLICHKICCVVTKHRKTPVQRATIISTKLLSR